MPRADRSARLKKSQTGFTLVEVLVAVAVVALAVTTVLVAMTGQIDGTSYLRDKMFAHWVAENQLELALLRNAHSNQLPQQKQSGTEEMAGATWHWRAEPKRTGADGFIQLEITVHAAENDEAPALATLTGILDQAHKTP
jgi:general secretion pathway protein I